VPKLKVNDFNLKHSLECGQIFRQEKVGDWYYVNSRDRLFKLRQKNETLEYDGVDEEFVVNFCALDVDLDAILKKLCVDDHIRRAVRKYRGLRLLRQDPWECLISYICSAANTIPNIRKTVNALAERFGAKIKLDDYESYTFPEPGTLGDIDAIREAKTGFRAEHIVAANGLVTDKYLRALPTSPYEEAKSKLMQIPGVADKIADCVLLFSMGFYQAFPVDTWIRKGMCKMYFKGQQVSAKRIREFASIYFGEYAGYAQEYLFHEWRTTNAGSDAGNGTKSKT